jgi:hypothetical protein
MTNDFGTSFRADFSSEEDAEIFAEDWVMNK